VRRGESIEKRGVKKKKMGARVRVEGKKGVSGAINFKADGRGVVLKEREKKRPCNGWGPLVKRGSGTHRA